jgi:protein import protein ZIM17
MVTTCLLVALAVACIASACILPVTAFQVAEVTANTLRKPRKKSCPAPQRSFRLSARARRRNPNRSHSSDDDEDANDTNLSSKTASAIPQLPASGDSSFGSLPLVEDTVLSEACVVNKKIGLQYTCNQCETRNSHLVSRIAYKNGVVITTCKGCGAKHLIADHLGSKGFQDDKAKTIEDVLTVHRVSPDQFQISKLYNSYDTKSGSIVGEDGNWALE